MLGLFTQLGVRVLDEAALHSPRDGDDDDGDEGGGERRVQLHPQAAMRRYVHAATGPGVLEALCAATRRREELVRRLSTVDEHARGELRALLLQTRWFPALAEEVAAATTPTTTLADGDDATAAAGCEGQRTPAADKGAAAAEAAAGAELSFSDRHLEVLAMLPVYRTCAMEP